MGYLTVDTAETLRLILLTAATLMIVWTGICYKLDAIYFAPSKGRKSRNIGEDRANVL